MQIDCFELGDFATNAYLVRPRAEDRQCLIIDPGFDPEPLIEFLQNQNLQPLRIVLTHGHCDHIAGLEQLTQTFGKLPVAIGRGCEIMLTSSRHNLSLMMGQPLTFDPADELLDPGDVIELNTLKLNVLATPGHTPGCISLYGREHRTVFTGDALFAGSIGRTDFPGGNMAQLLQSIREQLLVLPEDTTVYSGHGPATTIGREKRHNPFLR